MSNILLLTPQLPYPPHQGTSMRNFYIIKGLAKRHQITVLSYVERSRENEALEATPLNDLCQQVIMVTAPPARSTVKRLQQMLATRLPDMALRLRSKRFRQALERTLRTQSFDIVQVEGIEMAWTIEVIRQVRAKQKIVYDAHNAEALLQYRALLADIKNIGRWPAAAYSWVQHRRLRKFEVQICKSVEWISAVSQADKETLMVQMGSKAVPISVIPNNIDVVEVRKQISSGITTDTSKQFDILFVGKMDYRPNIDAVLWFADQVWPHILTRRPGTTWAIVGQRPHARLDHLRDLPGITITGWVEEVQPYLVGASTFVMPFRVGSGTRLKLIEALAAGKAVVSTEVGIEGYPITGGQELLIADDPEAMASALLMLLEDKEQRKQLGERGREFAEGYDWRRVVPLFNEIYEKLA